MCLAETTPKFLHKNHTCPSSFSLQRSTGHQRILSTQNSTFWMRVIQINCLKWKQHSTHVNVICQRSPRNEALSLKWGRELPRCISLIVGKMSLQEICQGFTEFLLVCCSHFIDTSIPKIIISPYPYHLKSWLINTRIAFQTPLGNHYDVHFQDEKCRQRYICKPSTNGQREVSRMEFKSIKFPALGTECSYL